jgi:dUTP pyrophosphatase
MRTIPFTVLSERATPPSRAHEGDAGIDLSASTAVILEPGERALVETGLAVAIPIGHVGFVCPRSGLAIRKGVTVLNAPGVIDAGYRGELKVALINLGRERVSIRVGERIAQLVIQRVETPGVVMVDELPPSLDGRGEGGFGSSGR